MESKIHLLEPVLSGISLTTIFKVGSFDCVELPDSSREIHVNGKSICSEEPVEIYIHGFADSEIEEISSTYSIGSIVKISGSHNILSGGLLVINNPTVIQLSQEVSETLEIFYK